MKLYKLLWKFHAILDSLPLSVLISFNICPYCHRFRFTIAKRPTRTMYPDLESNYEVSCLECFEEHDRYWQERWDEYYQGVL